MTATSEGALLVRIDDLRRCLATAFERLELMPEDADGLAELLVDSELRGHSGHGAAAVAILATLYRDGKLNPRPSVRVLSETDGAIMLDGDRGCGAGAPTRAMQWCTSAPASARAWLWPRFATGSSSSPGRTPGGQLRRA